MGKKSEVDSTACPFCGHSPILESDERCPKCANWVRELPRWHPNRAEIHNDAEQELGDAVLGTPPSLNVVTNAAEANPGLSANLLIVCGVMLASIALGQLPGTGSTRAYLELSTVDLMGAILLLRYPAIIRRVIATTAPFQALSLLYVGRAELRAPEMVTLALVPMAVAVGLNGNPSRVRRNFIFCCGLGLALYSGLVRLGGRIQGTAGTLIDAPQAGFYSRLPEGMVQLGGVADLASYVRMGDLDPDMAFFTFGDASRNLGGLWALVPGERYLPPRLAQGFAEILEAPSAGAKPLNADLGLKVSTTTYERGLGAGRIASATAFPLPDARIAVLLLAGSESDVTEERRTLVRAATFGPVAHP